MRAPPRDPRREIPAGICGGHELEAPATVERVLARPGSVNPEVVVVSGGFRIRPPIPVPREPVSRL